MIGSMLCWQVGNGVDICDVRWWTYGSLVKVVIDVICRWRNLSSVTVRQWLALLLQLHTTSSSADLEIVRASSGTWTSSSLSGSSEVMQHPLLLSPSMNSQYVVVSFVYSWSISISDSFVSIDSFVHYILLHNNWFIWLLFPSTDTSLLSFA